MKDNREISQSLHDLSDAIESLAMLIAKQSTIDEELHIKPLSLIAKRFSETTKQIEGEYGANDIYEFEKKQKANYLTDWLSQRDVMVGRGSKSLRVDGKLSSVAEYLADHYIQLEDFYSQLKRFQNIRRNFKSPTSSQSISYIRKWCDMLHQNKIIDSFHFLDQNLVDIDIAEIHNATLFINGLWLELFLRKELAAVLSSNVSNIQSFDILAQTEIVKPDNSCSEIDLLLMLNDDVYWFECKSGNIGEYYDKFAEQRKLLKLDSQHSFIVVPMMQLHQAKVAMKRAGMQMLYATNLESLLAKILF